MLKKNFKEDFFINFILLSINIKIILLFIYINEIKLLCW